MSPLGWVGSKLKLPSHSAKISIKDIMLLAAWAHHHPVWLTVGEDRGGLDPLPPGFNPPTTTHFFPPFPHPIFFPYFFFRVAPPKIPPPPPPNIWPRPPDHFSWKDPYRRPPNPRAPRPANQSLNALRYDKTTCGTHLLVSLLFLSITLDFVLNLYDRPAFKNHINETAFKYVWQEQQNIKYLSLKWKYVIVGDNEKLCIKSNYPISRAKRIRIGPRQHCSISQYSSTALVLSLI